jgi:hypothetical protein
VSLHPPYACASPISTPNGYSDERFTAREAFRSDHMKVVWGYFEPGQFIPVHAPSSDIASHVREGLRRGVFDPKAEVGD